MKFSHEYEALLDNVHSNAFRCSCSTLTILASVLVAHNFATVSKDGVCLRKTRTIRLSMKTDHLRKGLRLTLVQMRSFGQRISLLPHSLHQQRRDAAGAAAQRKHA